MHSRLINFSLRYIHAVYKTTAYKKWGNKLQLLQLKTSRSWCMTLGVLNVILYELAAVTRPTVVIKDVYEFRLSSPSCSIFVSHVALVCRCGTNFADRYVRSEVVTEAMFSMLYWRKKDLENSYVLIIIAQAGATFIIRAVTPEKIIHWTVFSDARTQVDKGKGGNPYLGNGQPIKPKNCGSERTLENHGMQIKGLIIRNIAETTFLFLQYTKFRFSAKNASVLLLSWTKHLSLNYNSDKFLAQHLLLSSMWHPAKSKCFLHCQTWSKRKIAQNAIVFRDM